MKKTIFLFLTILSLSTVSFSQNQAVYNDLVSSSYRATGGNYNKVKLIFSVKEGANINNVVEDIKSHMHMKDPNGFFNPYWITGFPDEAIYGNDGVIIGTWYTEGYSGWSTWTAKLKGLLDDTTGLSFYKVQAMGTK